MKTANKNEKKLVFLEDIKEQLTAVTDDTTCPLHIAAEVDQILELAAPVKAIVVPPVKLGDTVFYIMGDGKIYEAKVSFLQWQQNIHGITSEIRGTAISSPYFCFGASFEDWGKTVFATKEEAAHQVRLNTQPCYED